MANVYLFIYNLNACNNSFANKLWNLTEAVCYSYYVRLVLKFHEAFMVYL